MKIRIAGAVAILTLAGASLAFAADPSFSGTWKLNLAKSKLSGQTFTIDKKGTGYHFESQGFGYDFDLSGKEFPTPDGGTASWKAPDANTWEGTNRMNGKTVSTYRLSLKGDAMTAVMTLNRPDGSPVVETSTDKRVSGGPGFVGKWKSGEVKGAPTTLELKTDGVKTITIQYPEFQGICTGAFDGRDYPIIGSGATSKNTLVFEKRGANQIRATMKMAGKELYVDTFTLSADGKTLTDDGNAVTVNEPAKLVYERIK